MVQFSICFFLTANPAVCNILSSIGILYKLNTEGKEEEDIKGPGAYFPSSTPSMLIWPSVRVGLLCVYLYAYSISFGLCQGQNVMMLFMNCVLLTSPNEAPGSFSSSLPVYKE